MKRWSGDIKRTYEVNEKDAVKSYYDECKDGTLILNEIVLNRLRRLHPEWEINGVWPEELRAFTSAP